MIPAFDDRGYLPPGVYSASLDEIADHFGQETELRRVQMDSLRWLVDQARVAGIVRSSSTEALSRMPWSPTTSTASSWRHQTWVQTILRSQIC